MKRRSWLIGAGLVSLMPGLIQGRESASHRLWLRRASTGEAQRCVYAQGEQLTAGYGMVCHLLRDVRANQQQAMDVRLLNLLAAIQGWLVQQGVEPRPMVVLSGYRTRATNQQVGGVPHSLHLAGQAADIQMPDIPADYLAGLAASFQQGGVGLYLDRGFVHVDTGRVRYWRA